MEAAFTRVLTRTRIERPAVTQAAPWPYAHALMPVARPRKTGLLLPGSDDVRLPRGAPV